MICFHFFFPDIDECTHGTHECSCNELMECHVSCTNDVPFYTCSCSEGFELDVSARTCVGMLPLNVTGTEKNKRERRLMI